MAISWAACTAGEAAARAITEAAAAAALGTYVMDGALIE